MTTETLNPKVHDYLSETLVTDTVVYRVTKVTDKSIWIVPCGEKQNGNRWIQHRDGNPYPCVYTEVEAYPDVEPLRLGRRKDGTFRRDAGGNRLRPCTLIMGSPVKYTDYRE